METPKVEAELLIDTNIVARDRDGDVVLLAEVKARTPRGKPASEAQWVRPTWEPDPLPPFFMLVDLENISIFRRDERPVVAEFEEDRSVAYYPLSLVTHLKSSSVLGHYDAEFGQKPIYEFYLGTLVEAWLRDLAYHWNSESPPGSDQLAAIGLLSLLEGGFAEEERSPGADPLR
jgi:hypothetical protein